MNNKNLFFSYIIRLVILILATLSTVPEDFWVRVILLTTAYMLFDLDKFIDSGNKNGTMPG